MLNFGACMPGLTFFTSPAFFNPCSPNPSPAVDTMDSLPSKSRGNQKPRRRSPPVGTDTRKRAASSAASMPAGGGSSSPCGACKFLRRKCLPGCVFAAHFASEQGAARFAAVHKVFGASNVSKLLSGVPGGRRHDAVVSICYEAQTRISDPVYGCVSTILALQQQVASLQTELSIVHSQLLNRRLAIANAVHGSHQARYTAQLQPAYSNNSSASTDRVDTRSFPASFHVLGDAEPPSKDFEPLQLLQPSQDEEVEETSHSTVALGNEAVDPK